MKVYWSYTIGDTDDTFPNEFVSGPKKYLSGYDMEYDHAKCPAWKQYYSNTWVIAQPFDLGIKFKDDRLETNIPQKAYDQYFHVADTWLNGEYPEIQLKYNWFFWTKEKNVWVEQLSPPLLSRQGVELIQGTFPISVWFRPIVIGMKLIDNDIFLPRGTPLSHIRFPCKDVVRLEQRDPPEDLKKQLKEHNTLRLFAKFKSWDIIQQRLSTQVSCPLKWN